MEENFKKSIEEDIERYMRLVTSTAFPLTANATNVTQAAINLNQSIERKIADAVRYKVIPEERAREIVDNAMRCLEEGAYNISDDDTDTISDSEIMGYYEIFERVAQPYRQRHGPEKIRKIGMKVLTSDKISGLISRLKYNGTPPASTDFLYCLHEIPYFLFSSYQTVAIGALLALERWNLEVNSQQHILPANGLNLIAIDILKKLKL